MLWKLQWLLAIMGLRKEVFTFFNNYFNNLFIVKQLNNTILKTIIKRMLICTRNFSKDLKISSIKFDTKGNYLGNFKKSSFEI
jgi:hypothetical protein